MPERIQRRRTKGFKMPENTVSVTRPGEWGNPFVVGGWYKIGNGQPGYSWTRCLDESLAKKTGYTKLETVEQCIEWYRNLLRLYPIREERLLRIRGKNLACFCPLGQPCHADVLLELANATPSRKPAQ